MHTLFLFRTRLARLCAFFLPLALAGASAIAPTPVAAQTSPAQTPSAQSPTGQNPTGPAVKLDPYRVNDPLFARDQTQPAATYKIEGSQLELMNLANTEDSLKYAPDVFVRKRFIGDQNGALTIRGTHTAQSARSLVLADGMVLSNFLGSGHGFSPRWGLVAPEEIASTEVVYGPYSALYPGNALGGVVLFTTGFPDSLQATAKASFFFNDYSEYATDDVFTGRQASVSVGDRKGKFAWFVFYNWLKNEGNPTDFRTLLVSSTTANGGGTPVIGAMADNDSLERPRFVYGAYGFQHVDSNQVKIKLAYDLTDTLRLSGGVVYFQRDVDTFTDTFLRDAAGNPVTSGRVDFQGRSFNLGAADFGFDRRQENDLLYSLALRGQLPSGWDYAALASAFVVADDTSRSSSQSGPAAAENGPGLLSRTGGDNGWRNFDFKAVREFDAGAGAARKHILALGYHYDRYRLETEQFNTADWPRGEPTNLRNGQTGETSIQAFFAQDAWQLGRGWSVTPGLRYELWEARDGSRSIDTATAGRVRTALGSRDDDRLSPKLSLAWRPSTAWVGRLSVARSYRFATVSELYQGTTAADGTVSNNDPNLKTERALSTDLTVERSLPSGAIRASVFHEDLDDTIFSQTNVLTRVTNFQNIPRVRTQGIELNYDQRHFLLDSLSLTAGVSYTESTTEENPAFPASVGKRFPRIPRWRGTLFATWRATEALNVSAGWRYATRGFNTLDNLDPRSTYGGSSGYSLIDLRASYDFRRKLTLAAGVDNATRFKFYQGHNLQQRVYFLEAKLRY